MVGVMNWLKGYLRIRVSGTAVERFLDLCGYKNILLWNVNKHNDSYEMYISLNAFKMIRPIVRKTKTKVVVLERLGLPFFLFQVKHRKVFVFGFMFAMFIWYISGFYIWQVEINGNSSISEEQLEDYLLSQQVKIGIRKSSLNIEALEKNLRIAFPQISWTSGKIDGTTLLLEIKEAEGMMETEKAEDGYAYNLVSDIDGEIHSIIVRKGVPKVKQGDVVTKDMILVEGIVPVFNDDGTIREYINVKADADIFIKYHYTYEERLPDKYIKKEYTGRKNKIPYLYIGEKEFSPRLSSDYLTSDLIIQEHTPTLFKDLNIAIKWGSYTYREYMNLESLYSKEEAKDLLMNKNIKFMKSLMEKGVQILEKDVKIVKTDTDWILQNEMLISAPVTRLISSQNTGNLEAMENQE